MSGATSYALERAPDNSGSPGAWVSRAGALAGQSFADTGLSASTKYWYRVRASNSFGNSPYSPASFVTTLAITSPSGPVLPATLAAFPGCQGAGCYTRGGFNTSAGAPKVYRVTSLATGTGAGMLGECIAAYGPRVCTFAVAGRISGSLMTGYTPLADVSNDIDVHHSLFANSSKREAWPERR